MHERHYGHERIMHQTASALDRLEGLEARVTIMRFLGDYPHEQIARELDLPVETSQKLACSGLKKVKDMVFPKE